MKRKIFNSILITVIITNIITIILINILEDNILIHSGVFVTAVLMGIVFALRMADKITRPLIEVNPDAPEINYSEVNPLIDKIRIQKGRISRQKHEVQTGREQLSLITENMNQGIVIADTRTNILSCNSGALRLLDAENISVGESIYLLNDSDIFRHCIRDAMGGRNSSCIIKTAGGDREIIASPSNITDTVNGIVVFIFDVTEKQQLETMRREFTSNVSHELKTPITTIYGIADMLTNGMVKPEDTAFFIQNIRNESERLISLINDIVALSKLDENSVTYEKTDVDLYSLAENITERLRHNALQKNIEMNITGEHINFNGNKTILDEIIYNLCDNAIKYNNKNSGHVEVKISHIPTKVLITVKDDGMGIPKEDINRIFERFYRVDKSRSGQIKGTGLGLSIVKHGVMYHNGIIRAESKLGRGSVFTVELPVENKK